VPFDFTACGGYAQGKREQPQGVSPFVLSVAAAKSKHERIYPACYAQIWNRRGTTAASTSKWWASEEGWVSLRSTQRWDAFHLSQPTTALQLRTGVHHLNVDAVLQRLRRPNLISREGA
jgi:hypothetical protein